MTDYPPPWGQCQAGWADKGSECPDRVPPRETRLGVKSSPLPFNGALPVVRFPLPVARCPLFRCELKAEGYKV